MQSEESPAYPATTGLPGRSVFPEPWLGGNTELASRVAATAALLSAGIGVDSNITQSLAVCEQSHKENNLQRSVIRNSTPGLPLHEIMSLPTSTTSQQQAAATTIMNVSQMASAANGAGLASQSTNTGGASGNSSSTSASSQFQKLKVEDALSYLDQVKLQFGNQPQVYNDFLDIMKEFKSQSIDTPGVISRVSNLFKGHPDLIVGFNTFLPPGFKIEVHHNEINISGPAQHSHTLAKIAQAHNSSTNAASSFGSSKDNSTTPTGASAGGTQANPSSSTDQSPSGSFQSPHQPVEFNHAINYVNKIKNRFQQHPDIYKAFLEILHKYQKEQRIIKEGGTPQTTPLSESEVYSQVSGLFQNQEDLLSEFGQFLPDATASFSSLPLGPPPLKKQALSSSSTKNSKPAHGRKGSQSGANSSGGPSKKPKSSAKDVLAEAGKHTNYAELALFDKIQKSFRNQEVYNNFLRCLVLFNEELISRNELVQLVTPFLGKYPELFTSFKTLLGFKEPGLPEQLPTTSPTPPFPPKERVTDFAAEIDYKSLKRHGASYRALPKTYVQPKCSGRSLLCKEVLNDMWVSFPMWSEDSTFEGTRKTQFEEYIFRCEDERFELDVVLETNLSTIKYLEALQKKMAKMSQEELAVYTHDITLGGNSEVLQRKAIHRIYGDKAHDIIDGLMKSPNVAVPVVLKRLKAKQEEWMEAQRAFNKVWRDQLEKYYLKSLDHQGINFKQVDTRAMRSKAMCAEVEAIFDERQEQMVEGTSASGPHLKLSLQMDPCIFNDAVGLVLYYTKRASSLQHSDALKIRSFLTHTMADLCFYPRVEVSSEDDISLDSDSDAMDVDTTSNDTDATQQRASSDKTGSGALVPDTSPQYTEMDYHVIFANNSVYSFFRLFQLLCERLNRIYQQALASIKEETEQSSGSVPIAVQLGLKKLPDIKVDEYYPTFLSMAKNFMEGNIDATTYEDTCREMFGVHAYVVFTIDRLVQNIVRQLLAMVVDSNCYQVMVHYNTFVEQLNPNQTKADTRTGSEMTYQRKVEAFLGEDNCYRITITWKDQVMSVELLDTDDAGDEENQHEIKKWQTYVEKYAEPEADPELSEILAKSKIFLKRSLRHMPPPNSSEEEELKVKGSLPDMEVSGAIEFKMDKKSYRMIPLAKSEDYLYNKQSLKRAREVNNHVFAVKHSKFEKWHSKWLEAHTTQEDATQCSDWLLGKTLPSSNHLEAPQTPEPLSQSHEETYQGHKRTRYTTHNTSRDNSIVCSEQMSTD